MSVPDWKPARPWKTKDITTIDANGRRSESAAQWTILEQQDEPRRIRLTINSDPLAYPLVVDPSFSTTGSMTSARYVHTSTLLPNGKVLIAGGYDGSVYLNTAELYEDQRRLGIVRREPNIHLFLEHRANGVIANGQGI